MKESLDKIIANAELASETLSTLEGQIQNAEQLWTYFHLRPTTAGVMLVSTLPYAPMSAALCSKDDLADKIQLVDGKMGALVTDKPDYPKMVEEVKAMGFGHAASAGGPPLAADQAAFITGMNQREDAYGELNFITSEFVVPKVDATGGYHFDVLAYYDEALYFCEITKVRSKSALTEMGRYMTDVYKNQEEFLKKLFAVYPLTAPGTVGIDLAGFHRVQGLVLMPEAEIVRVDWQSIANEDNIETWFYKPAFVFRKYLPMNRTAIL